MTISYLQAVSMGSNGISSVADPVNTQDAATKNYVDTKVAGSARTSSTAAFTTTETVLSSPKLLAANTFKAGTTVRFVTHGQCVNSNALGGGTWEARIRMGTAGTTADGVVCDSGSITAGGGGTTYFELSGEMTCQVAGSSGTFKGYFSVVNSAASGMVGTAGYVATGTMTAANTTAASYVNLTLVGSANITFTVYTCTFQTVVY